MNDSEKKLIKRVLGTLKIEVNNNNNIHDVSYNVDVFLDSEDIEILNNLKIELSKPRLLKDLNMSIRDFIEIEFFIKNNKKIHALKKLREVTNFELKECKLILDNEFENLNL